MPGYPHGGRCLLMPLLTSVCPCLSFPPLSRPFGMSQAYDGVADSRWLPLPARVHPARAAYRLIHARPTGMVVA